MEPDLTALALLAELAALQAGHIAMWQARLLGLTRHQVHNRARKGGWADVHRSVWRLGGVPPSGRGVLWAGMLAVAGISAPSRPCGGQTVEEIRDSIHGFVAVTGWSAAECYGFDRWRPPVPQLLADARTVTRRDEIRLIRSRLPIAEFVTIRHAMPVTFAWRMLWDAAHLSGRGEGPGLELLVDLIVYLDRRRILAVDLLLAMVEEPAAFGLPSRVPRLLLAAAAQVRPGFSHSATEARARSVAVRVCRRMGLTLHPRPYKVRDDAGRIIGEVDLAIPEIRFGAEVDGPHHREPTVRAYDQGRDRRLRSRAEWSIVRYDSDLVDQGDAAFERRYEADLRAFLSRERV